MWLISKESPLRVPRTTALTRLYLEERLAHLTSLPEAERERPEVAKRIDMAEVDLGKREAQLTATAGTDSDSLFYYLRGSKANGEV